MIRLLYLALFAGAALSGDAVLADGAGEQIAREAVHIVFTEAERKVIREFFGDEGHGAYDSGGVVAKKGGGNKGKRSGLPPGLKRKLDRDGALPPGLEKKALPPGLRKRLPEPPPGYERVIVDTDVLLVEVATGIIRDVIRGVLN